MEDITWDKLAIEFNKTDEAFERVIKSFESVERTWQELIDYAYTLLARLS